MAENIKGLAKGLVRGFLDDDGTGLTEVTKFPQYEKEKTIEALKLEHETFRFIVKKRILAKGWQSTLKTVKWGMLFYLIYTFI